MPNIDITSQHSASLGPWTATLPPCHACTALCLFECKCLSQESIPNTPLAIRICADATNESCSLSKARVGARFWVKVRTRHKTVACVSCVTLHRGLHSRAACGTCGSSRETVTQHRNRWRYILSCARRCLAHTRRCFFCVQAFWTCAPRRKGMCKPDVTPINLHLGRSEASHAFDASYG